MSDQVDFVRPTEDSFKKPWKRRTFDLSGVTVVEYLFENYSLDDRRGKLMWVRDSLDRLEVDGKDNMLVHVVYDWGIDAVDESREKVEKQFRSYWGLAE